MEYVPVFVYNICMYVRSHTPLFVVIITMRNLPNRTNNFVTLFSQYVCHVGCEITNLIRSLLHKYGNKLGNSPACLAVSEYDSLMQPCQYVLDMFLLPGTLSFSSDSPFPT